MRENITTVSTQIIRIGLVIIAFFIPIFFLPTTSEFYNFNKSTLLIAATLFLFFVWGIKMAAEQRVRITRTPLDVPLLVFLIVYILSTIFSIDPATSILGWHPVFFNSLPAMTALVALYFLATSHLNASYRQAIYSAFITSATLLALVSIIHYLGHPLLDASWAQSRNWTPAGDLDKLAAFLAIIIPLSLGMALLVKETAPRYILFILAAIQIIALVLLNSLFAFIALGAALLFVILFLPKLSFPAEDKVIFGVLAVVAILLILVVNIPGAGDGVLKPLIAGDDKSISLNKPIRLPLTASWQTSAQSLASRPLFGSGPATFGLVYPSFKPLSINTINKDNLWNIRFDESGSGLMTLLATTGAFGTLAFLLVIFFLGKSLISFSVASTTKNNSWFIFVQSALVAGLVSLVLFNFNALNMVALVLLTAAFFSTLRDWGATFANEVDLQLVALRSGALRSVDSEKGATSNALSWVVFAVALLLFGSILFYLWRTYAAEFYYQKAILASQNNQGRETRDNLVAAINANPYRDTYHRALLATDLALARSLNQAGQELNQDQQNTLLALIREAIDQGRIATGYEGRGLGSFQIKKVPGTSSLNVANWESIATVYSNIGGQLRNDATVHAINTFAQAIRLDPTNPRLYDALGNVYFSTGDLDNSIKNYELSVSAKPDYASGHYNLAQAVRRKGDNPARVVNELQATLQLLEDNEQNKDLRSRVEKELEEARKKLEETAKQQQSQQQNQIQSPTQTQPTVELQATPSANQ